MVSLNANLCPKRHPASGSSKGQPIGKFDTSHDVREIPPTNAIGAPEPTYPLTTKNLDWRTKHKPPTSSDSRQFGQKAQQQEEQRRYSHSGNSTRYPGQFNIPHKTGASQSHHRPSTLPTSPFSWAYEVGVQPTSHFDATIGRPRGAC